MINVVAVITAKQGKRSELLMAFNANCPTVHAEDGCIEYVATVDADGFGNIQTKYGEDTFVVIEKWQSKDHLMAHAASDHMKTYAQKTKDLIAERKIYILSTP